MVIKKPGSRFAAAILLLALFTGAADAGVVPPLAAYGALPQTEELALSPNGEMLAQITTKGENRLLVVQKLDGTEIMIGAVGDLKVVKLAWAGDEHVLIFTHVTARLDFEMDNYEYEQGVIANVKTQKFIPLVSSKSFLPAVFGQYGYAQEDGKWYGYFGLLPMNVSSSGDTYFKQNYTDLYKIALDTGSASRVAYGTSKSNWVLDRDGRIAATSEYNRETGDWKVMTPGSSKPVASGHAAYGFALAGLGRSPGTVIVVEDNTEGINLRELNLADGTLTNFLTGPLDDLIYTRGLVTGVVMAGERERIEMFDPALSLHMKSIEKAFGDASLSLHSVSADLSKIVVYVEGENTTGTWQLVDFNTKHATPLADAYLGIPNEAVGAVQIVDYRAGDGLAIKGILTLPPGPTRQNLPLVVLPHGGPEAMDKVRFDWWAQAFASRGYAVFQPNFRGSSGHGNDFRNAGFGQWGRKMQTDISDGVADLAARGVIDPKRVCIVGASYGGYAALAGVTLQHGIYRCAASYAGVSDPSGMLRYTSAHEGSKYKAPAMRYWRSYFGIGESDSSVPDEISPLARAKEADTPILLIHGKDDTTVPIEQSERMERALRNAGKPVEYITLKGEDHWLSRSATRLQMLEAMMDFVQKYNPPDTRTAQ